MYKQASKFLIVASREALTSIHHTRTNKHARNHTSEWRRWKPACRRIVRVYGRTDICIRADIIGDALHRSRYTRINLERHTFTTRASVIKTDWLVSCSRTRTSWR